MRGNEDKRALAARFFVEKDAEGCLPINLRFVDTFLRWRCGRELLAMELFPNTKEITESMACLEVVSEELGSIVSLTDPTCTAVVVGDGRTPRTGALLAMRTRWAKIVSIDPALHGLTGEEQVDYKTLPKELQSFESQEQTDANLSRRAKMREDIKGIDRLEVEACKVEETEVALPPDCRHVVLILPHAHVTPDEALKCLNFTACVASGSKPTISVVQLPCCGFVWHDTALGLAANKVWFDPRIASGCRTVRVWPDVSPNFDFSQGSLRGKNRPRFSLTEQRIQENKQERQARAQARKDRKAAKSRERQLKKQQSETAVPSVLQEYIASSEDAAA